MRSIIAVIIFSLASAICAAAASANISPFVPPEPSKMEADVARAEFLKTKFARMSQQQQQQQPQPEVKLQETETTTNKSNIPGRFLISSDHVYDLV